MNSNVDVTEYARRINIPTLVLHCKGDQVNPLKEGRRMASVIPNAYFKTLTSNYHVLLEGKHEFSECFMKSISLLKKFKTN